MIYRRVPGGLELEGAGFGNGRIVVSDTGDGLDYTPLYFVTDHLGSTRVVVKLTDDGPEVLERSDYLPYGGRWEQSGTAITDNRFRFNGKELQTTGFPYTAGILDYGWRVYGPRLGRWNNPDPLAELDWSQGSFNYCVNSPVMYIDLLGLFRVPGGDFEWGDGYGSASIDPVTCTPNTPGMGGVSGGGGNSGGGVGSGKNSTNRDIVEEDLRRLLEKYNDIVSDINSVVSTSIDLAKLFSKEEIAALVKAGKITRGAGRVGVAVDAGLMVDAAINGDPWEWHLYNTTIGLLKTVRRWPVVGPAATMVDSYVQAGKWLWEAVKWTNTSGVDYMMHYSIFGY